MHRKRVGESIRVPLFIEFEGRNVLIVGGGSTATRRALKFARAGARVRVISRDFTDELIDLERRGAVELFKMDLSSDPTSIAEHIRWADLVVLTIPDERICERIRGMCKENRKLVNDAVDASKADVIVPLEASVDGIRIAVTTEGKSSIAARRVLEKLVSYLTNDAKTRNLILTWSRAKRLVKDVVKEHKLRMKIYEMLDRDEVFNRLAAEGDVDKALEHVERVIKKVISRS